MTITVPDPLTADFAADFEGLAAYLREKPGVARRLRARRIVNIPLDGSTADERIADLHAVAREMGTEVEWCGGILAAAVHFGGVTLEAHHNPLSIYTSIYTLEDAARARRAA